MPKTDEDWGYGHYEEAWAVFIHCGDDDEPPPSAVFYSRDDAEKWVRAMREAEFNEDLADCIKRNKPRPIRTDEVIDGHYLKDAAIMPVRNAYIPYWNSYTDIPDTDPPSVPDWAMDDLRRAHIGREPINVEYRNKLKELKKLLAEVLELTTKEKGP